MEINKDALIASLYKEIEYLKFLLKSHNIPIDPPKEPPSLTEYSIDDKIGLYRSYFKGTDQAYARGYINKEGKKGFARVCKFEDKPLRGCPHFGEHGCKGCGYREDKPLTDNDIKDHLSGKKTYGIYPILGDDTCYFLAIDFDHEGYKECALGFANVCRAHGFSPLLEVTSSGEGAHVWLFFSEPIKAISARLFGYYLLLEAMEECPNIGFSAFDRMFPAQDYLPKGGYGNLIALPLQGEKAKEGKTVFVDDRFNPFPLKQQLAHLSSIVKIKEAEMDYYLSNAKKLSSLGPVSKSGFKKTKLKKEDFPDTLIIIEDNGISLSKKGMSNAATKAIERLACLPNPKYLLLQRKRQPVNVALCPRLLRLFQEDDTFIHLPRGVEDDLYRLLRFVGVHFEIKDLRTKGKKIKTTFNGALRDDQKEGVEKLLKKNNGLFIAPPSFGKTVVAIYLISKLKVNTLIVVPRLSLLNQWKERIATFLKFDGEIGVLKAGKCELNHQIDIASIDSLTDEDRRKEILDKYGLIIFDEAHHLGAKTYEDVARACVSKYLYGFTATLARSDGNHRIVTMTLGEVLYEGEGVSNGIIDKVLYPRFTSFGLSSVEKTIGYSEQLSLLTKDEQRNASIIKDIEGCYEKGRAMLLLSDRVEHLKVIKEKLRLKKEDIFLLWGSMKGKEKREVFEGIKRKEGPFLILSTGKYIGEGFDEKKLDTLFVATPFRWKGILRQYVGRLHRDAPGKLRVEVYDYIDLRVHMFATMYQERLRAYRKEHYVLEGDLLSLGKSLYDLKDYKEALLTDLRLAEKEICFFVGAYEDKALLELVSISSCHVKIYSDKDIEIVGVERVRTQEVPNIVVIDSRIAWYGGINPYMESKYKDSIMRIEDKGIASELLKQLKKMN